MKKLILTSIFFISVSTSLLAQQDLTLHLIPIIPQSNYTNPALRPTAKLYIGMPALSSLYVGINHSGFVYRDAIQRRSDDSLVFDMDNVLDKVGKRNYLSANVMEELLAFGFVVKKHFFSFSLTEKAAVRFSYPRELLSLIWNGNGQYVGETADLSGLGINAVHYREFAFGYAHDLNDKITVGGRFKYLKGLMNVSTASSSLTWGIHEQDFGYDINSDFVINCALPEQMYNSLDTNKSNDTLDFKFGDYMFKSKNSGIGIDLGATYKLNKKFTFGFSLLDFGYIKWKTNTRNFVSQVDNFVFDGVDVNDFFSSDTAAEDGIEQLLDSISDIFKFKKSFDSYTTPLTTKIYLTAMYSLTKNDIVGLLVRNDFYKGLHPSVTASYNKRFFNMLSASVSYTVVNRSYVNLGFGMALNLGPFQMYVLTDNFYSMLAPTRTKNVNVHFGMNFIFGYKEKNDGGSMFKGKGGGTDTN